MHGGSAPMPSRYPLEVALAEEYKWTPAQVAEMPADFVDEIYARLRSRYKWQEERHKRDEALSKQRAKSKGNKR